MNEFLANNTHHKTTTWWYNKKQLQQFVVSTICYIMYKHEIFFKIIKMWPKKTTQQYIETHKCKTKSQGLFDFQLNSGEYFSVFKTQMIPIATQLTITVVTWAYQSTPNHSTKHSTQHTSCVFLYPPRYVATWQKASRRSGHRQACQRRTLSPPCTWPIQILCYIRIFSLQCVR